MTYQTYLLYNQSVKIAMRNVSRIPKLEVTGDPLPWHGPGARKPHWTLDQCQPAPRSSYGQLLIRSKQTGQMSYCPVQMLMQQ
jgi:hypothetical protein